MNHLIPITNDQFNIFTTPIKGLNRYMELIPMINIKIFMQTKISPLRNHQKAHTHNIKYLAPVCH